jgi:hypothetical protein
VTEFSKEFQAGLLSLHRRRNLNLRRAKQDRKFHDETANALGHLRNQRALIIIANARTTAALFDFTLKNRKNSRNTLSLNELKFPGASLQRKIRGGLHVAKIGNDETLRLIPN